MRESTDKIPVTKLDKKFSKFNVYKINKANPEQENYYSANGGKNDWKIAPTASENEKYKTKNHFWDQGSWPDTKLNVIDIPPYSGFIQTNRHPKYDYTTDYLAHELAHAEQFTMLSGRENANPISEGPTEKLRQLVKNSDKLGDKAKKFLETVLGSEEVIK